MIFCVNQFRPCTLRTCLAVQAYNELKTSELLQISIKTIEIARGTSFVYSEGWDDRITLQLFTTSLQHSTLFASKI